MTTKQLPLTGIPTEGLPSSVIVCGDPGRASKAAELLSDAHLLSEQREYRCYTGNFEGEPVAVCSHGIGAPGAAIAFEELIRAGARKIIRVGTCGALQPGFRSGQLIIATAAVQSTGYGRETVPPGYPAVADLDLTLALRQAATKVAASFSSGIILSRDNFYRGVDLANNLDYQLLSEANVQAVEMECAALFIVGSLRGIQTAAILAVDGNVLESAGESMDTYEPGRQVVQEAVTTEIKIALSALV
jgi:uridine phosphorylase